MHPILFEIPLPGGSVFPVPSYGVLLALTFLAILKLASLLARQSGLAPRAVTDLAFIVFLAGLLGAKLLLILIDLPDYLRDPGSLLLTLRSAGVLYGGLLLAIPVGLLFARRRGLPIGVVADIAGVSIPTGEAIGRWGCFLAGCCWGAPTSRPWGVTFTSEAAHAITGVPLHVRLHPVQLYLAFNAAILALLLYRLHRRPHRAGDVLLWFLLLYGLTRSLWEQFRGDAVRGFLVPGVLSTSQAIGLATAALAGTLLLWRRRARAATGRA